MQRTTQHALAHYDGRGPGLHVLELLPGSPQSLQIKHSVGIVRRKKTCPSSLNALVLKQDRS